MEQEILKLSDRVTKLEVINNQAMVDCFYLLLLFIFLAFVYFAFFKDRK